MHKSFAAPARTGRPAGSRPKQTPQTVAEFVQTALNEPVSPPPPQPSKPRNPNCRAGIWETMTADERSAYAKSLAAKRNPKNMARQGRKIGTPNGWSASAVAVAKSAARIEAEQLVAKLQANGTIAPDDTEGAEATIEALTIVRSPGGRYERVKWAKRLLRHYCPDLAGML